MVAVLRAAAQAMVGTIQGGGWTCGWWRIKLIGRKLFLLGAVAAALRAGPETPEMEPIVGTISGRMALASQTSVVERAADEAAMTAEAKLIMRTVQQLIASACQVYAEQRSYL
jgi:hypothetical protein